MKVLAWNILADEFVEEKYYKNIPEILNRKQRKKNIIKILNDTNADIMLLQEVMRSEYNSFSSEYHMILSKNVKWQGKQSYTKNVILLRKSFKINSTILLEFGVGVHCLYMNKPLLIFSIHLDDVSHSVRMKQMSLLLDIIGSHNVIIGGDFNEIYTHTSKLYKKLKDFNILNKNPTYLMDATCIDNIVTKGIQFKVHVDTITDYRKQMIEFGSDHLPVIGSIE